MTFTKIALPYAKDALMPYLSEEAITYHYEKHHQTYEDNLNKLVANTDFEQLSLEEIIKTSSGGIFNNAAQFWNHNFYWECLSAEFDQLPTGKLHEKINQDFGSFDAFKTQFINAAATNFGSGWTWLIENTDGKLEIINTSNADNPLTKATTAKILLTVDIWEHSYYIDTRNNRMQYLENFFHIINWKAISKKYEN